MDKKYQHALGFEWTPLRKVLIVLYIISLTCPFEKARSIFLCAFILSYAWWVYKS